MSWARRIQYILHLSGFLVAGLLLAMSCLFWYFDYDQFVDYVLKVVDKEDWQTYFRQSVFPKSRFLLVRYILVLLSIFGLLFLGICFRYSKTWSEEIVKACSYFYGLFKQAFSTLPQQQYFGFCVVSSISPLMKLTMMRLGLLTILVRKAYWWVCWVPIIIIFYLV